MFSPCLHYNAIGCQDASNTRVVLKQDCVKSNWSLFYHAKIIFFATLSPNTDPTPPSGVNLVITNPTQRHEELTMANSTHNADPSNLTQSTSTIEDIRTLTGNYAIEKLKRDKVHSIQVSHPQSDKIILDDDNALYEALYSLITEVPSLLHLDLSRAVKVSLDKEDSNEKLLMILIWLEENKSLQSFKLFETEQLSSPRARHSNARQTFLMQFNRHVNRIMQRNRKLPSELRESIHHNPVNLRKTPARKKKAALPIRRLNLEKAELLSTEEQTLLMTLLRQYCLLSHDNNAVLYAEQPYELDYQKERIIVVLSDIVFMRPSRITGEMRFHITTQTILGSCKGESDERDYQEGLVCATNNIIALNDNGINIKTRRPERSPKSSPHNSPKHSPALSRQLSKAPVLKTKPFYATKVLRYKGKISPEQESRF